MAGKEHRGPQRTCIGCRATRSQDELERYVRLPDGTLASGRTVQGRGAWLCKGSQECLEAALQRRAFGRALRAEIRSEELDRLRENAADRVTMDSSGQGETDAGKD